MKSPAFPSASQMERDYLCKSLSPGMMPIVAAGRISPNSLLQDHWGLSFNVASLLQCEREMALRKALENELAMQGLKKLCVSPKRTGISKPDLKRVTKATAKTFKKDGGKGKMGPLPPPPNLVSMKQWQKMKLQLKPSRPMYNPSA
eukprot:scaffold12200_cov122-Cylindrotheca_fusiformis.AAC.7